MENSLLLKQNEWAEWNLQKARIEEEEKFVKVMRHLQWGLAEAKAGKDIVEIENVHMDDKVVKVFNIEMLEVIDIPGNPLATYFGFTFVDPEKRKKIFTGVMDIILANNKGNDESRFEGCLEHLEGWENVDGEEENAGC